VLNYRSVPVAAQVQRAAADTADALSAIVWQEEGSEVGGLVWGRLRRGPKGPTVWVAAMTPGIGRGSATDFEISPGSFAAGVKLLRAAGFPEGLDELGLWHSHPGYGAFLSAVDEEYFRLCYPQSWTVSIVIDPVRWERAVFVKSPLGLREIPAYIHSGARFGAVPALDPYRAWDAVKEAFHG
jgi:proteasome lid subunit RPN8/RPN11